MPEGRTGGIAGYCVPPSLWVVTRARGEPIGRLMIPTAELLGDTPYVPPRKGVDGEESPRQPMLLPLLDRSTIDYTAVGP